MRSMTTWHHGYHFALELGSKVSGTVVEWRLKRGNQDRPKVTKVVLVPISEMNPDFIPYTRQSSQQPAKISLHTTYSAFQSLLLSLQLPNVFFLFS